MLNSPYFSWFNCDAPTVSLPVGTRHGAACCSVAGLVYALGGFDGQTVLSSAERFDAARRGDDGDARGDEMVELELSSGV